jgi:hypothetical protein
MAIMNMLVEEILSDNESQEGGAAEGSQRGRCQQITTYRISYSIATKKLG